MKVKKFWWGVSFLLAASFAFASPSTEEGGQQGDVEESGPQYGGTLTIAEVGWGHPTNADNMQQIWPTDAFITIVLDHIGAGDIEKYGPRGSNDFAFRSLYAVPAKYKTGGVTESWELSPDGKTLTFHVRQGVMWAAIGKEHVMESRELTAHDIEFSWDRYQTLLPFMQDIVPVEDFYAKDKYTFVVEMPSYTNKWEEWIMGSWASGLYAPEVVEAGASDWDNLVGTGPFMFKEQVVDSYLAFERNPLYYDTAVINGAEYELPFVDELVVSIIADESTAIAALRTGQIDLAGNTLWEVPVRYEETLRETSPDLKLETMLSGVTNYMGFFRYNQGIPRDIFNDKDVRQALMIGTDMDAIAESSYGKAEVYSLPVNELFVEAFTPLDQLPESSQLLYEYDAELAKQMLANAGYPDGFEVRLPVDSANVVMVDQASLIKDQWSRIGVDVDIKVMETGAYNEFLQVEPDEPAPYDLHIWAESTHSVGFFNGRLGGSGRIQGIPEYFTNRYQEAERLVDREAANVIFKEMALRAIDEVYHLPFGTPHVLQAKWPWVMNWYGETEEGGRGIGHILSHIWIDEKLKAELGY